MPMTSVTKEAGGRHRDGGRESEGTGAVSRLEVSLGRGAGSEEEREGQESTVTTRAAEGPHSGAERALGLKPRIGRRAYSGNRRGDSDTEDTPFSRKTKNIPDSPEV